jgi:hypothetical protein
VLTWLLSSRRRVALALSLVVVALPAANPKWARSVGLDVWNFSRLEQEAEEARAESLDLIVTDGEVQQRIAVKEALISDLIEGRTTLAEVTDRFAAMNKAYPEYVAVIRANFAGRTDRERTARNVIAYARCRIANETERVRVLGRLEAELVEMT